MFPATDSTESRRWRLPCDPIRSLRNPNRPKGISGDLWHPLDWYSSVTSLGRPFGRGCCPIGQGLETGGKFPGGQNPLCLDSPDDFSAKPGILAACLGKVGARRTAKLCFLTPPSEPAVRLSRKVGAERTAELCFPTPPSDPAVQVSLQRALQELAFRLRPYDRACHPVPVRRLPPKVRVDFTTLLRLIGYRERQLPGSLRHVASFPSLRLL